MAHFNGRNPVHSVLAVIRRQEVSVYRIRGYGPNIATTVEIEGNRGRRPSWSPSTEPESLAWVGPAFSSIWPSGAASIGRGTYHDPAYDLEGLRPNPDDIDIHRKFYHHEHPGNEGLPISYAEALNDRDEVELVAGAERDEKRRGIFGMEALARREDTFGPADASGDAESQTAEHRTCELRSVFLDLGLAS